MLNHMTLRAKLGVMIGVGLAALMPMYVFAFVALLGLIALGYAILRGILYGILYGILRQLGGEPAYASRIVAEVAQGDLTVQVQWRRGGQSRLLFAMKSMVEKLASVLGEVSTVAVSLAYASEPNSATAQSLSQAGQLQ